MVKRIVTNSRRKQNQLKRKNYKSKVETTENSGTMRTSKSSPFPPRPKQEPGCGCGKKNKGQK